jgi:hypothetical protein
MAMQIARRYAAALELRSGELSKGLIEDGGCVTLGMIGSYLAKTCNEEFSAPPDAIGSETAACRR